jgi:TRAP-type C4-dicarboxylate transport system permease small subunit
VIPAIKKATALAQKLVNFVIIALMVAMTVVMFAQVVLRVTGAPSLMWGEEALRFMFIWTVFLGLPTAIYYNDLTRFDLLMEHLPPFFRKALESVILVLIGVILYFIATGMSRVVTRQMRQMATSMPIPMGVVYYIIPVCAILAMCYIAIKLFLMWAGDTDTVENPVDEVAAAIAAETEGQK